ncbi:MAG: type II toxin-antitoxin system RelB/DinJ family antitoxin [Candidatus Pacebacteria bacterium]|nr:type II toxin-antitoxin system RelB/DinJ family antitoxin [Candidatus Paceibacterota bacterium]
MNTTIQIRIDQATKVKAQKRFKAMGVSLSFAIKYFLKKVSETKNLKDFSDLDKIVSQTLRELKSLGKA